MDQHESERFFQHDAAAFEMAASPENVYTARFGPDPHACLCTVRSHGPGLSLTGEIDLHNVAEIESVVLAEVHGPDVHLDLSDVGFIDSLGVTMILRVYAHARQNDWTLRVICSGAVHAVLAMSGLAKGFPGLTVALGAGG